MRKMMIVFLSTLFVPALSFAQPTANPLRTTTPVENVNRQTFFNNLTDSMATMGKDPQEKKRIKEMRREDRRHMRLRKQDYVRVKKSGKNISKEQKAIMKKHTKGRTNIGK